MELIIEDRDGLRVVRISGELDTFGARHLRDSIGVPRTAERLVVDLGEVSFVDSAGLHALFAIVRLSGDVGAGIAFVVPEDNPVRRVIELVQLADVCPVCESFEVAVTRLATPGEPGLEGSPPG